MSRRVTPIKTTDLRAQLERKGFIQQVGKQRHITYILYVDSARTDILVGWSHSYREVDVYTQRQIYRRMKLSKEEFAQFVECSLDYPEYVNLLHERNWL